MVSPRMTRSAAAVTSSPTASPEQRRLSPPKKISKTRASKAASAAKSSKTAGLETNDGESGDEADSNEDNDDSDANDEPADVSAPLTSPLAARSGRTGTPLTSENLAKVQAAHKKSDWAGPTDDIPMFEDAEDASSSGSGDSDIDIADDDDDYDDVDQVSAISDSPSNESKLFEAEVEREIQAEGEEAIDWDREETYRYNADFADHQFTSFALPEDDELSHELFGARHRRPSQTDQNNDRPLKDFLKGIPLHDDWPNSDSDDDDSSSQASAARSASNGNDSDSASGQKSGGSDDDQAPSASAESDEDSTDDEGPVVDTIKTPSVTLAHRPSPKPEPMSEPVRKTMRAPETPVPRKPGKYGIMRRFKLNPNKAIAYSRSSPNGRIICFTQPRQGEFRFVSARTSRSSSIDSGADIQDPVLRAQVTDAIRSSLFRRFNCASPTSPLSGAPSVSGLARTASYIGSPFHSFSGRWGQIDETIASSIEEDEHNLIDFDGGASSIEDQPRESFENDMKVKNEDASMPPPPFTPAARAPRTPESGFFPHHQHSNSLTTPSPKKRRNSDEAENQTTLTPAMKKQRVNA